MTMMANVYSMMQLSHSLPLPLWHSCRLHLLSSRVTTSLTPLVSHSPLNHQCKHLWTWTKRTSPRVTPPPLDPTPPVHSFPTTGKSYTDPLGYLRTDTHTLNAYLGAESAAASHFLHHRHRKSLARISTSLASLLQVDRVAPPVPDIAHGWAYWTTTSPRGPVHWRRPWITAAAKASPPGPPVHLSPDNHELLLDPTALPPGHTVKKLSLSPSHGLLGYLIEPPGQEFGTLHIRRLGTPTHARDLDAIPVGALATLRGLPIMGFEFLSDTRIAYTVCDGELRPGVVMMGDWRKPAREHVKLVEDPVGFIDLGKTKDERFLTINASTLTSSQVYVYPTATPRQGHAEAERETEEQVKRGLVLVHPREEGHQYFVDHHGSRFYILTNTDQAHDFKVVNAPTSSPGRASWTDLVVPDPGDKLEDVDLFDGHLVLYMRRKGQSVVMVHPIAAGAEEEEQEQGTKAAAAPYQVPVPKGTTVVPGVNMDYHSPTVRMILQQPYEYDATVDWDLHARQLHVRRRQPLPRHEINQSDFDLTRTWATSCPSTGSARIPVTLLHRRGLELNGANPLLLRAYGAYGLCLDPVLRLDTLALVRAGWVVALAHVRGGGELGRAWHAAGRLTAKSNSMLDLVDVAAHLHGLGVSQPGLTAAAGHSAGGLAVAGAALTRPDMFKALVLHAPFVDVLGSMTDPRLPLTRGEYEEWGDPCSDLGVWEAMRGYSPYEQVMRHVAQARTGEEGEGKGMRWPHLYVTAGRMDQRTPVWQTAKFVAGYRHLVAQAADQGEETKVVFHVDEDGNHFGETAMGQDGKVEAWAREVAFLNAVVLGERR